MSKRPFYEFSAADDHVWSLLYQRMLQPVQQYAHPLYLEGLRRLNFPADRLPNFYELNDIIYDAVGWELVSTDVQYSDGQTWFEHLSDRKFLITEYIRDVDSLDYTPLPDIWHDTFGHLPYMVNQDYADYMQEFGQRAIEFPKEVRDAGGLGSLWWYSIEFGLMKQGDDLKAFGAGLMSGFSELIRSFDGQVTLLPYTFENVGGIKPSPHVMHQTLFVIDSFEQMHTALADWCAAHREQIAE